MNQEAGLGAVDGYTQATSLAKYNIGLDVKRVHVDAIATQLEGVKQVPTLPVIEKQFEKWSSLMERKASLGQLLPDQLKSFVTASVDNGGLGLSPDNYENAFRFATLQYEQGIQTDWNFFFGNKLGCFGETSVLACLLGAMLLIYTRVGSWRTMAGMVLGAYGSALIFEFFARHTGIDGGAWNSATLAFPAYKHLLLGGLAFGAVFMATDPVSSAALKAAKWVYGIFIGVITIFIRTMNPAYPEGVMLAILAGNVFAPLIDHYVAVAHRRFVRAAI
jgi:Na+-transporting NADH:ubiquinone oxidoreductase subunit B